MIMPKKPGMKRPPHGDKYKHLAALKPPFVSNSAVLTPEKKPKTRPDPKPKFTEVKPPDEEQ